jgi:hypothetical protein
MPNQRSQGKVLLGGYFNAELAVAVDLWLERNAHCTLTDFLVEAVLLKLLADEIPVDVVAARRKQHRRRTAKAPAVNYREVAKVGDAMVEHARASVVRGQKSKAPSDSAHGTAPGIPSRKAP